jgi:RecA-family ATPase
MSKLQFALSWAARGFRVFPLREDSKVPIHEKFYDIASTDPATIAGWWRDPLTGIERNYNIGVDTSALLVVDLDNKDGKNGQAAYEALGGRFDTLTIKTPTGGYHLYYDPGGATYASTASGIAPGVDTRGYHGYVVAPGSTIDGRAYELLFDAAPGPIPAVVLPKLRAPEARAERTAAAELDTPSAIATARAFLAEREPATQGMGGDDATFRTICEVRDRGVSEETALALLLEDWNERCEPPWNADELQAKVANAYAYAQRGEGEKSPEAYFGGIVLIEPERVTLLAPGSQPRALNIIDLAGWLNKPVPDREWLVPDLIPMGVLTALYGDGGMGKSMLILQLAVSMASGALWCGLQARGGKAFCYLAEDDEHEVVRRLRRICKEYGVSESAVAGKVNVVSAVGEDNLLMTFDRSGLGTPTPLFESIRKEVIQSGVRLVMLDTNANLFGGNEIEKAHVVQFTAMLNKLALDMDGAVLLLAHPSQSGMTSGRMTSGNVHWNNGVRSRLALKPVPVDGVIDPDLRLLTHEKANLGKKAGEIMLRSTGGGVLVPLDGVAGSPEEKDAGDRRDDAAFIAGLERTTKNGVFLSARKNATNYAPRVLVGEPECKGMTKQAIAKAMQRLLATDRIRHVEYGRAAGNGNKPWRLEIVAAPNTPFSGVSPASLFQTDNE